MSLRSGSAGLMASVMASLMVSLMTMATAQAQPAQQGTQAGDERTQDVQARVEVVQSPGWVQRGQQAIAMRPGILMQPGDVIHTGDGGRAWVDLADGTRVRLGGGSRLSLEEMSTTGGQGASRFRVTLDLAQGTARMQTTQSVAGPKRRLVLRAGSLTATVQGGETGTGLIAVHADEVDRIIAVDGSVEVGRTGSEQATTLTEPGQSIGIRADGAAERGVLDEEQMATSMAWGELATDRGHLAADAPWEIVLMSVRDGDRALEFAQGLARDGFPVDVQDAEVEGETWHRVLIPSVASREDADMLAVELEDHGVSSPWIRRR